MNNILNLNNSYIEFLNIPEHIKEFAILKLYVNGDDLKNIYINSIQEHNKEMNENLFFNSGFDLYIPNNILIDKILINNMINLNIKAEMIHCNNNNFNYSGYYLYPRSSISKTLLMMSNHIGIIDSGYRGYIQAAVRLLTSSSININYEIDIYDRLFQIVHPSLCRIYVVLVDENELSITKRGEGGFGSTGK